LSPTEVNDILWALALHGSNSTSTKDEVTLSETASTLRETAYDRMVEWLEMDLGVNQDVQVPEEAQETVTFEVVDAAALLASEQKLASTKATTGTKTVPVENITVKANAIVGHDSNFQEVQVVDAAKLLASASSGEEVEVETEVIVAPVSVMESSSMVSPDAGENSTGEGSATFVGETQTTPIFTPHDLASIAWSVTELRDPLKTPIVGMVIKIFSRLGYDSLSLSGADLSNLAWAIAKYDGGSYDTESLLITRWIAEHVSYRSENIDILRVFQPPELGRVMWAIACTMSNYASAPSEAMGDCYLLHSVARKALRAAANNLSIFSTEDLVRIAWAFLEIADVDLFQLDSSEVAALGLILATTEMSLHRWERGDCTLDPPTPGSHSDASVFSSFFGRPRINLPLLDLSVSDEEDDDEGVLSPVLQKSQRPKLRDLSIDPSTLCKAACSFQRLSARHPYIKGGWTLTRVAIRLLSSKNARLMKECSIHDIARLCEAAVLSEVDGHGRELMIGLFARQVVGVLNGALDEQTRNEYSINIDSATSSEIVTLIWALGELGVRRSPAEEGKQLANKKLHLQFLDSLLSKVEVESLNLSALQRLIRGMVLMKLSESDQTILLPVLKRVTALISETTSANVLCSLAESVGVLKELEGKKEKQSHKDATQGQQSLESTDSEESTKPETNGLDPEESDETKESSQSIDLSAASDDVLALIAKFAKDMSKSMNAEQIRRLCEVYSLLPFQADEMINAFATEASSRMRVLEDLSRNQTFDDLLKDTEAKNSAVKASLFGDSDVSLFDSIRHGFMSLFGSSHENSESEKQVVEDTSSITDEIATLIQDSIAATSNVTQHAQAEEAALRISLDDIFRSMQQGTSFELGRALELIENYRRIEFSTGRRRSRYDRERRNDIAKRVLSRLLP